MVPNMGQNVFGFGIWPFWPVLRVILGSFWGHFGVEAVLDPFGVILGCFRSYIGYIQILVQSVPNLYIESMDRNRRHGFGTDW
jgi:hypothetical protein